ncbi:MAG TPA: methyltransferase domain-containing protein [Verrucomicrobiae bacterium]
MRQTEKVVWSAADYASNSTVQQTWARELIAKLKLRGNERILDVGCGDGKITAEIARAIPRGEAVGVDASPQMIEFATRAFSLPNLKFQVLDARHIKLKPLTPALSPLGRGEGDGSAGFDVVFSNAALHWVDDHEAFLRGAASVLRPGGRLIVSCGGKGNAHDVFLALRPEMRLKRWREFFRKMEAPYFFHSPEEYKKWLPRFGFETGAVKLAPKDATYPGRDGFTAWLRTTWLPYTQRVPESAREEFIECVVGRYVAKHPVDAKGLVHVRMVRLEIDATRL